MVHDLETDEHWLILCNKWLAVDMSDGLIDKRFPVATNEQLKKFTNLFGDRTTRGLTDGHLWFSVFSRPARSHFTRLQRLSCCLALLMTTMLTSIMFYGIPDDPADQAMDFGSFRITVREIIIGIESAIIAFPINLLIVQIFRMAQAQKAAHDYSKHGLKPRSKKSSEYSTSSDSSFRASLQKVNKGSVNSSRSSSAFEMLDMTGHGKSETKLEEVKIKVSSGEIDEADSKSGEKDETDSKSGKNDEADSKSSSWSSLGGEEYVSCTSVQKGSQVKATSTCDSALSYFAAESQAPSEHHVAEDAKRTTSLTKSSSFKKSASGDVDLPPTSESRADVCKSFGASSVSAEGSFSKDDSSSSDIAKKPRSHNEILLSALQDIATDLDNMIPDKSRGDLKAAQERSQTWILLAKSLRTPESTVSSLSTLSTNDGNDRERKTSPARKGCCRGGLPHWFVYVGWLILILTTGISAYYIMLYGLKYGKQRSIDWLVSVMISTFQEIFITQPLKIFLLAVFVAMILKKWEDDDDGGDDLEEIDIGENVLVFFYSIHTKSKCFDLPNIKSCRKKYYLLENW